MSINNQMWNEIIFLKYFLNRGLFTPFLVSIQSDYSFNHIASCNYNLNFSASSISLFSIYSSVYTYRWKYYLKYFCNISTDLTFLAFIGKLKLLDIYKYALCFCFQMIDDREISISYFFLFTLLQKCMILYFLFTYFNQKFCKILSNKRTSKSSEFVKKFLIL